jgi:ribose 5-phosphate isomerase B
MRVGIATDHGGFGLKEELVKRLRAAGHEIVDFGAHDMSEGDDYPDYVLPLARAVATQGVEDDHMNVLCMGGRTVGPAVAWDLVQTFLAAEFSQAPRHLRRLGKIASLEAQKE